MAIESGLEHLPGSEGDAELCKAIFEVSFPTTPSRLSVVHCPSQEPENAEMLIDVALLDAKIAEAESEVASVEVRSNAEERRARERREDLKRLKRVEVIYVRKTLGVATGR